MRQHLAEDRKVFRVNLMPDLMLPPSSTFSPPPQQSRRSIHIDIAVLIHEPPHRDRPPTVRTATSRLTSRTPLTGLRRARVDAVASAGSAQSGTRPRTYAGPMSRKSIHQHLGATRRPSGADQGVGTAAFGGTLSRASRTAGGRHQRDCASGRARPAAGSL